MRWPVLLVPTIRPLVGFVVSFVRGGFGQQRAEYLVPSPRSSAASPLALASVVSIIEIRHGSIIPSATSDLDGNRRTFAVEALLAGGARAARVANGAGPKFALRSPRYRTAARSRAPPAESAWPSRLGSPRVSRPG